MRATYEQTMRDWRGCEAIVRQREREKHAEALARCSSGASVERGPVQRDSTISTDVSLTVNPMQPFWPYRGGASKVIPMFTEICFFLSSLSLSLFFLQSSLSSSSEQQNTNSQSDSSSAQVVPPKNSSLMNLFGIGTSSKLFSSVAS